MKGKPEWAKVIKLREKWRELGKKARVITITAIDWDEQKIFFQYDKEPAEVDTFELAVKFYEWYEKEKR